MNFKSFLDEHYESNFGNLKLLREGYSAYSVSKTSQKALKKLFKPENPEFIGDHITYKYPADPSEVPGMPKNVYVIGHASEDGLEALVVSVNGKTARPDGNPYHITWSIDRSKGKKPVDSNRLVQSGFEEITPIKIRVVPEFLK
jgi:hypothetical protein